MLIRGGFGEGKSHLLTCLEHNALDANYAVCHVVISKETPLQIPAKVLASAVENLRVPNTIGRGLDEIGVLLHSRTALPEYREFVASLTNDGKLNSRFGATLALFEVGRADEELADRILRFWSGDKLNAADVKRYLREAGVAAKYVLEPIRSRELALETFTFLPLLVRAAGLRGLVLLLDEVELIGRYTRLGRGRSYAELARWLGHISEDQRPGLLTVAAITSDYAAEVLMGKQDKDQIEPFLGTRYPDLAPAARQGMGLIEQARLLASPSKELLDKTYHTLRRLHGEAYNWNPPEVLWPELLESTAMRTFVRAWINAWDVRRLYPDSRADEHGYEVEILPTNYGRIQEQESDDGGLDANLI